MHRQPNNSPTGPALCHRPAPLCSLQVAFKLQHPLAHVPACWHVHSNVAVADGWFMLACFGVLDCLSDVGRSMMSYCYRLRYVHTSACKQYMHARSKVQCHTARIYIKPSSHMSTCFPSYDSRAAYSAVLAVGCGGSVALCHEKLSQEAPNGLCWFASNESRCFSSFDIYIVWELSLEAVIVCKGGSFEHRSGCDKGLCGCIGCLKSEDKFG